jgi:hypothetical protein
MDTYSATAMVRGDLVIKLRLFVIREVPQYSFVQNRLAAIFII